MLSYLLFSLRSREKNLYLYTIYNLMNNKQCNYFFSFHFISRFCSGCSGIFGDVYFWICSNCSISGHLYKMSNLDVYDVLSYIVVMFAVFEYRQVIQCYIFIECELEKSIFCFHDVQVFLVFSRRLGLGYLFHLNSGESWFLCQSYLISLFYKHIFLFEDCLEKAALNSEKTQKAFELYRKLVIYSIKSLF